MLTSNPFPLLIGTVLGGILNPQLVKGFQVKEFASADNENLQSICPSPLETSVNVPSKPCFADSVAYNRNWMHFIKYDIIGIIIDACCQQKLF